jgi:hypothetical protein
MSKFVKVYNFPGTPTRQQSYRVSKRSEKKPLSVEETHTPEQLKHLHACIHYTHTIMGEEAQRRIEAGLPEVDSRETPKSLRRKIGI